MTDPPVSFWHAQLGPEPPRDSLWDNHDVDVCIVGAGYTGLWTAYELKRAEPSLRVVVLEAEHVGFGASGRNGGWVTAEIASGDPAMAPAMQATVDEIGAAIEREGIDCGWVKGGSLTVATTPLQLQRISAGLGDGWRMLDADEAAARVRVAGMLGAAFTPHCARVQPAALVRGLAAAAERLGVEIYENTRAKWIGPGFVAVAADVGNSGGSVKARYVVRAIEGYHARLAFRRRRILPLRSCMIVTEQLSDAQWAEIGWERCETMLDGLHRYVYLQRTPDGRIAIGGRGVPYRYASRIKEGPLEQRTVGQLRERLTGLFPSLREVRVDHAWHGVLGVPRDWSPSVGLDEHGFAWGGGYVGEGVAASNLAGRTLRDLILGRDTDLTRLPWVGHRSRSWEPEPLRFAGVRAVYALLGMADRSETRTGKPSLAARAAGRLAGMP